MAQAKSSRSKYDALIIGGGLAGLATARALAKTGQRVVICEERTEIGGQCRSVKSPIGEVENGLKILPNSEAVSQFIPWLAELTGLSISTELVEAAPVTFDLGKFQPYVGFGDQAVESLDEVTRYALQEYRLLNPQWLEITKALSETEGVDILTQSTVTKLNFENGMITGVMLNGSQPMTAGSYYVCCGPQILTSLLPDVALPAKLRQRLLKGAFSTSVHLDIVHDKPVTTARAVHVLKGANEEPSVGIFHPEINHDGKTIQLSQWVTFVSRDHSDETEIMANALKQIQRQLKRAYPTALEGKIWDRIVVRPLSHGDLNGFIAEDGTVAKITNLKLICGHMHPSLLSAGALFQAHASTLNPVVHTIEPQQPDAQV